MRFPWVSWRECFAGIFMASIPALGVLFAASCFFPSILPHKGGLVGVGAALWIGFYFAFLWFVNSGRAEQAERDEGWRRNV